MSKALPQNYRDEIALFYSASQKLSRTLDVKSIFNTVLELITDLLPLSSLTLSRYDRETQLIHALFVFHEGEYIDVGPLPPIPLEEEGHGIQSRVIRSGKPLLVDDYEKALKETKNVYYYDDEGHLHPEPDSSEVPRSALLVPMKLKDEVVGVLSVSVSREDAYTPDHMRLLEGLASHVAIALNNAFLYQRSQEEIAERKRIEQRLESLASHDALTGLANRSLAGDRLQHALTLAERSGREVGVLFIDLDDFKMVNDVYYHEFGDKLLQQVAVRLLATNRECDTVARMGGDEFLVMIEDLNDSMTISEIAERVRVKLAQPFIIEGVEILITASVGISIYPTDGETPQALLQSADMAMYRAKAQGGDAYRFFSVELLAQSAERVALRGDLRNALEREELRLDYQPQVDLCTGKVVGVEALLRWQHPEKGLLSPGRFVPLAESSGEIAKIGLWVLRTACLQNHRWNQTLSPGLRVAVNVSERQLKQPDFREQVKSVLDETGLLPENLEIELTENIISRNIVELEDILARLKTLGVRLAVDDFGVGYSNLNLLSQFDFDVIKIDRVFAVNVEKNPKDVVIISAVMEVARKLGIEVVVEGVETEGQLAIYRSINCSVVQGYLYSRPVPPGEMARMLNKNFSPLSR